MNHRDYEVVAKGSQSSERTLSNAINALTYHGFRIESRTDREAELTGPGLNSTRQNPLLGASRVRLQVKNGSLQVNAELGGVQTMRRFLTWFPLILGMALGSVFSVVGGVLLGQQNGLAFGVPWAAGWKWLFVGFGAALLPVSPWLFISPIMIRWITNRTKSALDTMAHNATLT
jgi:hypothetical protein